MSKFKVGQTVEIKCSSGFYNCGGHNPTGAGIITSIDEKRLVHRGSLGITVDWGKGITNVYDESDLKLVEVATPTPSDLRPVKPDPDELYRQPKEEHTGGSSRSLHSHYFKDVTDIDELDIYALCDLFKVEDNSGAVHHAIKKLLLSGGRGGGKDYITDLKEARDTLNRKIELEEMKGV